MWRDRLIGLLGKRGVVLLALLAVVAACGGDEIGKGVSEGCLINSDCSSPLVCAFRKCHVACTSARDCNVGQRCVASDKPNYVCQLPEETTCSLNSDCPVTQKCGVDSQCRDQCAADRDCLGGQVCAGGTCADPEELHDGVLPVVTLEAGKPTSNGQPCLYTSECPEPLVCRDNVCANACAANSDCPSGSSCISNRCVSGAVMPIGPEGGVASSSSGKVKLTVPPGSLKTPVAIMILPLEAWPSGALGAAYEIVPTGTVFDSPATLTFTYAPGDIGAIAPSDLHLAQAVGSKWTVLDSKVDAANQSVSASLAHLSVYGMLGPAAQVDAGAPTDASMGGSDGGTSDGGGDFSDVAADRSVGLDAKEATTCTEPAGTNIGAPCTTDCDCVFPGLVAVCSNDAYPMGSINPTPVCVATSGATAATVPDVANCDGIYGVALGSGVAGQAGCYPACFIDGNGSHGCNGKDTCMYVGYTGGAEPMAWGYCWGGCTGDQDCPSGEKCQLDLGYCLKPAFTYVVSKPVGTPCTSADNNVNCNCGGRSAGIIGSICTSACQVGGTTCPQGFTCDAMVPTNDPFNGRSLYTDVGPAGTWGNCAKNCISDADCAAIPAKCVLHAGMTQTTCDNGPQFVPDAGTPVIDAGIPVIDAGDLLDGAITKSVCATQACTGGDGCCPYGCNSQNDSDCAAAWSTVSWGPINYSNVNSSYCSDVYIYGVAPSSNYAFTTCNPSQSVGTGDPMIVSITDNLNNQYLTLPEDSCLDSSSIPSQLDWYCQNASQQPTMFCSQSSSGIRTVSTPNVSRLIVTICATSPAGAGTAPFYIFYNSTSTPNPG